MDLRSGIRLGDCWKCGDKTRNTVNCCGMAFCEYCYSQLKIRIVTCVNCHKNLKEDNAFVLNKK